MPGHERASIRQRLLAWGPTYQIHAPGQLRAVVKEAIFTCFPCTFRVDLPGPDELEAGGDFTDQEYQFERGGRTVAVVSKRWFTWMDTYGGDLTEGEDDILILASTVVIDMACHKHKDRARSPASKPGPLSRVVS
jgi:uncharacterized protein YxjI